MLQFCTHIDFAYGLPTGTFSSKSVEQRDCDKDPSLRAAHKSAQRYAFVDNSAFAHERRKRVLGQLNNSTALPYRRRES